MDPSASPPQTEPRRTSNWPMWVLGFVIMIDQVDQNIVRGAQNEIARDLGLSDTQIGVLLSCFVLVNGLVSVPAGYLADRWRRTTTIGHTVILWSGITALTAAAPNYGSLVAVRSALGLGRRSPSRRAPASSPTTTRSRSGDWPSPSSRCSCSSGSASGSRAVAR